MRAIVALLGFVVAGAAWAQSDNNSHQQGINAGRAAVNASKEYINPASASGVVPNYGVTPAETSFYKQPNLSSVASARLAACQLAPSDPACQAILGAHRSASNPKSVIPPTDPGIAGVSAIQANPGAILGSLTGSYSSCTQESRQQSPELSDTQSCHTYYLREPDQSCIRELTVRMEYRCPVGTTGPTGSGNDRTCTNPANGQQFPASAVEVDQWSQGCSGLESRVPPGLLPPDGDNSGIVAGSGVADFINKCERKASLCLDVTPRVIAGRTIQRACWKYQNIFDCLSPDSKSDCNQPRFGQCRQQGSQRCVDYDQFFSSPVCTAWQTDFKCKVRDATTETVANCANQTYCLNGTCWDTGYSPDQDFARSVALLETQREAGKYLDPASMRVFKGTDNRCVKKLFGLVNCCNRGGFGGVGGFTNMAILLSSGRAVGGAVGSTYTYDALFLSDSPDMVLKGFEALFGAGGSSALAGMLAGEISVTSFMTTLVPGPWTLAMLAVQYSGLFTCPKEEQVIALKRDANLCVGLGEYCSKRLPVIRTCMERTSSFCCFNSKLARIINEQAKKQLGQGWGSAESPNCNGFTVAELQALDFSAMDLREFYAEIVPKDADLTKFTNRVTGQIEKCYYGQGKCPP